MGRETLPRGPFDVKCSWGLLVYGPTVSRCKTLSLEVPPTSGGGECRLGGRGGGSGGGVEEVGARGEVEELEGEFSLLSCLKIKLSGRRPGGTDTDRDRRGAVWLEVYDQRDRPYG